jgi:predicted RNA binding protein YcfA (HicA-like mRNA interferase family)
MPKLPVVSGKDMIRALEKDGFLIVRQKGSHVSL